MMYKDKHIDQADEFRASMGQPIGHCTWTTGLSMQFDLIKEEFDEFDEATYFESDANELKELCDLVYVCYQYASAAGWDLDEALDRVHASNMSKLVNGRPIKDGNGKVLKGPNYQPPILDDLV